MQDIYFQKTLEKLIGDDLEKAHRILTKLRVLEGSEEWSVLKSILLEARENLLDNFKKDTRGSIDDFYAYKQSLVAIDFLISLPSELIKQIDLYTSFLTKEKEGL